MPAQKRTDAQNSGRGTIKGFLHESGSLDKGVIDRERLANEETRLRGFSTRRHSDLHLFYATRLRHPINPTVLGGCCFSATMTAEMANTTPLITNTSVGIEPAPDRTPEAERSKYYFL